MSRNILPLIIGFASAPTVAQVDSSKMITWPEFTPDSSMDTMRYQKAVLDNMLNHPWVLDKKSIDDLLNPLDGPNPPWPLVKCGREKFDVQFKAGAGKIEQPMMKVLKDKLIALVQGPGITSGSERGLKVHYGLKSITNGAFEFTFGLQMVELKPTPDPLVWDVIEHGPFHTVTGSGDVDGNTLLENWQDGKDYWTKTEVKRLETGPFQHIQKDMDTDGFILQWDKGLAKMIAQNGDARYVRFYCIAEPNIQTNGHGEADYRHHLCAVSLDPSANDILGSVQQPTGVFTRSGVDLGTPCPPRCKKAFYPPYGIPARNCP